MVFVCSLRARPSGPPLSIFLRIHLACAHSTTQTAVIYILDRPHTTDLHVFIIFINKRIYYALNQREQCGGGAAAVVAAVAMILA